MAGKPASLWGEGSGRKPSSKKRMAESTPSIVTGDLFAAGEPRTTLPLQTNWRQADGSSLELELHVDEERVTCAYSRSWPDGHRSERLEFEVQVSWTAPHYGGRRAWLHCSRKSCGRRVGRLFVVPPDLACRTCANIRYRTQAVARTERLRARARDIRARLGQDPYEALPLARPKGMHWTTYERLRDELYEIETQYRYDLFPEILVYEIEKSLRGGW